MLSLQLISEFLQLSLQGVLFLRGIMLFKAT